MPRFKYEAIDVHGKRYLGEMVTPTESALRRTLSEQHLQLVAFHAIARTSDSPARLTRREAEELLREVAALTAVGDSLVVGLVTAADESESRRTARVMRLMAAYLARGNSLADAVEHIGDSLPDELKAVMASATQTDQISEALVELMAIQVSHRESWRRLLIDIAYPILVLCTAVLIFTSIVFFVVPPFKEIFNDFAISLPATTEVLFWWHDSGIWYLLASSLLAMGLVVTIPLVVGPATTRRLLQTMPIVGPIVAWSNAARWTRSLSVLIQYKVPLHEALALTARGQVDANLAEFSYLAAARVQSGDDLTQIIRGSQAVPQVIALFTQWGAQQNDLAAGLREVSTVLAEQAKIRASGFQMMVAPVAFYLILFVASITIGALMLPMFSLLSGLGGW
jgi:type II secretory pathway component PulF